MMTKDQIESKTFKKGLFGYNKDEELRLRPEFLPERSERKRPLWEKLFTQIWKKLDYLTERWYHNRLPRNVNC